MGDPVGLEVFRHRVAEVAEAMGATLQRAAFSANIKERLDYSCAVFDDGGRLLAQAAHIPVHLGAMPAAVEGARRSIGHWEPGDVVVLNDPFLGGSHLPDITTVSAVFPSASSHPVAYLATRAHHADVGGSAPGSLPLARDLYGEGLVIPPVHLARSSGPVDSVLAVICANSRTPDERRGDLAAQLAAHRTGEDRMADCLADGAQAFRASAESLLAFAERSTRRALSSLGNGRYRFSDVLDGDGLVDNPLSIQVEVTLADGLLTADFRGTSPQAATGLNAPRAVTMSAVYYVVACLARDVPINAGMFAAVRVRTPAGSLVNPRSPAAVSAGNVETSQRIVDVILGALAQAAPDIIPAASQGTMNNIMVGGVDPRTRRPFTYYETIAGGAGASSGCAGASALQVHMTNTRNTPVEALEIAFPMRIVAARVRRGSGGCGSWPGGDGVERTIEFLVPARVTLITERRRFAPWGLWGGGSGAVGIDVLETADGSRELPAKGTFDVASGDVLCMKTPGGGGWGAPPTRHRDHA